MQLKVKMVKIIATFAYYQLAKLTFTAYYSQVPTKFELTASENFL